MKQMLILAWLVCVELSLFAQTSANTQLVLQEDKTVVNTTQQILPVVTYANSITPEDLKTHLYILAGDEYGGRGTGQEGQDKAATYITNFYENWNLTAIGDDSTYFQFVGLQQEDWDNPSLRINGKDYEFLKDYYCFGRGVNLANFETNEVLFLGYGIDDPKYSDYDGVDVDGKVLLILPNEPQKRGKFLLTGTDEPSDWTTNWRKKTQVARKKGALAVLHITPNVKENVEQYGSYIKSGGISLSSEDKKGKKKRNTATSSVYISPSMAQKIMGTSKKHQLKRLKKKIDKKGKPIMVKTSADLAIDITRTTKGFKGKNLLGYIEGNDPKLKDELLIITAHYDHLGVSGDKIYNGADDDGSGTVALLEMAEAFVKAKAEGNGPRRSILIMHVTAEEKGLLGSEYYTDIRPLFPLENTIADLNVDMVGRVDEDHKDGNYVYVIGSDKLSSELHNINETANKTHTQLELNYRYNAEDDPNRFYYRSDHYNFAKHNIPVIFYFNGTHADYHQETDTPDKIDYEALAKRTKLIFHTAWELANRDERIKVDSNKK